MTFSTDFSELASHWTKCRGVKLMIYRWVLHLYSVSSIGNHPAEWNLGFLSYFPVLYYQGCQYKKMAPAFIVYTTLAIPIASTPDILFDIMICTAAGTPVLITHKTV